jgi:hypothetical protein
VDEDDAPAPHHLAEPAQPLHRRADLHLLPSLTPSLAFCFLQPGSRFDELLRVGGSIWLGFGGVGYDGP